MSSPKPIPSLPKSKKNIRKENKFFKNNQDGYLPGDYWQPSGNPSGMIHLGNGMFINKENIKTNYDTPEYKSGGFNINPAHKGFCSPMTKSTCTGARRQFAINAKNHFKKQHENGGILPKFTPGGFNPNWTPPNLDLGNTNTNMSLNPQFNQMSISNPTGGTSFNGLDTTKSLNNGISKAVGMIPGYGQAISTAMQIGQGIDSIGQSVLGDQSNSKLGTFGKGLTAIGTQGVLGIPEALSYMTAYKQKQHDNTVMQQMNKPQMTFNANPYGNYRMGGKLCKYPNGGQQSNALMNNELQKFYGNSHEEGGIPINSVGIPTNDPNQQNAEVEGNESAFRNYIFSATLKKPGTKQTFASASKIIDKKYGGSNDPIRNKTKEMEYNSLMQLNENARIQKEGKDQQKMFRKGGYLPQFNPGGKIPGTDYDINDVQQYAINHPKFGSLGVSAPTGYYGEHTQTLWNNPEFQLNYLADHAKNQQQNVNGFPNDSPAGAAFDKMQNPSDYSMNPWTGQPRIPHYNSNPTPQMTGDMNYIPQNQQSTSSFSFPDDFQNWNDATIKRVTTPNPSSTNKGFNPDMADKNFLVSQIPVLSQYIQSFGKDKNYLPMNKNYGSATGYLQQLPTDVNIDANLNENNRDYQSAVKSSNLYSPSVGNQMKSSYLAQKLNANNQAYQTKFNTETQMKASKLNELSQLTNQEGQYNEQAKLNYNISNLQDSAKRREIMNSAMVNFGTNSQEYMNTKTLMKIMPGMVQHFDMNADGTWKLKPGQSIQSVQASLGYKFPTSKSNYTAQDIYDANPDIFNSDGTKK